MIKLNSEILQQFSNRGLSINEGNSPRTIGPTARWAVDARLVKSASQPMSNDDLKKEKEKRSTPEGKVDKKGRPLKFSRDVESD